MNVGNFSAFYNASMNLTENPLEKPYEWKRMDPREGWEQQLLDELKGFAALKHLLFLLRQNQTTESNQIHVD